MGRNDINLCNYSNNDGRKDLVDRCVNDRDVRRRSQFLWTAKQHQDFLSSFPDENEMSGFGNWLAKPNASKQEIVERKIQLVIDLGEQAELIYAVACIKHYLAGTGTEIVFSKEQMRAFKIIRDKQEKLQEYLLKGLKENRLSISRIDSFAAVYDASISSSEAVWEGADFAATFGASAMQAHGNFDLKAKGEYMIEVKGEVIFEFWDNYDLRDPKASLPIFGSDIYLFYAELYKVFEADEVRPKAKQFPIRSYWKMKFTGEYNKEALFSNWEYQKWEDVTWTKMPCNVLCWSQGGSYEKLNDAIGKYAFPLFIKLKHPDAPVFTELWYYKEFLEGNW